MTNRRKCLTRSGHCRRGKSPALSHTLGRRASFGNETVAGAVAMSEKLRIGDVFPRLTLDLVDGGTLDLPDAVDAKYRIFLFYRGHW
jgi:hypothetical protein